MSRLRLRPLRHRRRLGRRARGADRGRPWRAGRDRRGVPGRRHLRHPRLRAEEAAGLCRRLRRGLRGCARLRLDASTSARFDWPTLIANKDREIDRLEAVYKRTLEKCRRRTAYEARAVLARSAHDPAEVAGRAVTAALHPDRDRRPAPVRRTIAGHRARHHLERGLPPARAAAPHRDRRRRLYRRRVRRHLQRPRRPRRRWSIAASRSCAASTTTCATRSREEMRKQGIEIRRADQSPADREDRRRPVADTSATARRWRPTR